MQDNDKHTRAADIHIMSRLNEVGLFMAEKKTLSGLNLESVGEGPKFEIHAQRAMPHSWSKDEALPFTSRAINAFTIEARKVFPLGARGLSLATAKGMHSFFIKLQHDFERWACVHGPLVTQIAMSGVPGSIKQYKPCNHPVPESFVCIPRIQVVCGFENVVTLIKRCLNII